MAPIVIYESVGLQQVRWSDSEAVTIAASGRSLPAPLPFLGPERPCSTGRGCLRAPAVLSQVSAMGGTPPKYSDTAVQHLS